MVWLVNIQRRQGHGRDLGFFRILDDGQTTTLFDFGQTAGAIAVGAGQQHGGQGGTVGIRRRREQKVDGGPRIMHAVFQAQGKAAVLFHRQVIARRGEIQRARFNQRLVMRLDNAHGDSSGKHVGEMAATLVRQVQHHDDRQHEAFAQRAEDAQQRLHATGRSPDHDSLHRRQFRCTVHDLR
ncbi:hypothetical protein D3C84_711140 [compost metagenome]